MNTVFDEIEIKVKEWSSSYSGRWYCLFQSNDLSWLGYLANLLDSGLVVSMFILM